MAAVSPTVTQLGPGGKDGLMVLWSGLSHTNTTGTAVEFPNWRDRSVQIVGTFDSATVVIEGSNDGSTWVTLTDPQGNAISKTAAALEQIEEVVRYIRPSHSGGTASEDIDIHLLMTGREFR